MSENRLAGGLGVGVAADEQPRLAPDGDAPELALALFSNRSRGLAPGAAAGGEG